MLENLLPDFYLLLNKIEIITLAQNINCITLNELKIISNISEQDISMNELSDMLDITIGSCTVAINKLVNKNFVERKKDAKDKRIVRVKLTKKGLIAKNFNLVLKKELTDNLIKNIDKKDLDIFHEVFKTMFYNLEEMNKKLISKKLIDFKENDKILISHINGNSFTKNYIRNLGLIPRAILKIQKIDNYYIHYTLFNKNGIIPKKIAKNIIGTRKYDEI